LPLAGSRAGRADAVVSFYPCGRVTAGTERLRHGIRGPTGPVVAPGNSRLVKSTHTFIMEASADMVAVKFQVALTRSSKEEINGFRVSA
jgi:hypothetical protein